VCGRVCTHECQEACNRGCYDEAVAIRDVKRFVADKAYKSGKFVKETVWPQNGKRVAIVGAGPSGLTCAYFLALSGYEVDVFESEKAAGGVLLFGIPEYRLPKEILARDIRAIEDAGVNIRLNTTVGRDISFEDLRNGYDALYISTGTQFSKHADIPGEDMPGVYHGLDFLKNLSLGAAPKLGKSVVVIGGGNTAIDVSRDAVRMGAESVTILYRRRQNDMPAELREVIEAFEEGVRLEELAAPLEFIGNGKVEKIRCVRMEVGELDEKGRRSTKPVEGAEFEMTADAVIIAVSQYSDFPFIDKEEVELTEFGKLVLDEKLMTSMPGVFAGGDVVRGSDTAIRAIADGKQAAIHINEYCGMPVGINRGAEIEPSRRKEFDWCNERSSKMTNLPADKRRNNNDEVAMGLTEEQVRLESRRCYQCSGKAEVEERYCVDCQMCWEYCDYGAITMKRLPEDKVVTHRFPDPSRTEEVIEICRKLHLIPHIPGMCTCTPTTPEEVISAIFDGARTLRDITRMCGIRGACTMYCTNELCRILEVCGYPVKDPGDDSFHPLTASLWSLPDDLDVDPHFGFHHAKKIQSDPTYYEQGYEAYRQMAAERNKNNE
jgi:NADH-quinone oxidoreductase subunit F